LRKEATRMSNLRSIEAGQVLSDREDEASPLRQFTGLIKKVLIVIYLAAVLFSAIVVPMFRESIMTAVKNWLGVTG
jgi:hypothetical protein